MSRLIGLFFSLSILVCSGAASASSDSSCYPDWKVKHSAMNGCSSTALLSPGNDTRVNLLMLLHDRHGAVGAAGKYASDNPDRRGEAEPFDWASFAYKLGPSAVGDNETGDFPYGTRCMSNMVGSAQYIDAVAKARGLSAQERATLTAVRMGLNPQCLDAKAAGITRDALATVKSKAGRAFAEYLIGAASFYDGDFDAARQIFVDIGTVDSSWLAETRAYMLGRVSLNQSMLTSFDEYGGLSKDQSEPGLLDNAYNDFQFYLKTFPKGRYAASARGLLRRVFWLGNDTERLANEYSALFQQPATDRRSFPDLVQEVDIKLLDKLKSGDASDPMLLAVLNLRAMRRPDDAKMARYGTPPITRAALDAQKSKFTGNPSLFAYLQAVHAFYVADNPLEVLKLIPISAVASSGYLDFSRQSLRALALDATGNAAARPALLGLITAASKPHQRGLAELALAMHDERAKAVAKVFAPNSVIREPDVREILLRYHAGPSLLRTQALSATAPERERRVALYTLLYKQLTRGAYADFIQTAALVPASATPLSPRDYQTPRYTDVALFNWPGSQEFSCPSIRTVATALSVKPNDAKSLLCLGEFVRLNGLDPDFYGVTYALDELPQRDELGGSPSQFPGTRFSRLGAYKAVAADATAGPENRAYALYRAVNCYAPSAYNGCDSTEVPKTQRKAWFDQLKRQFPTSVWAKKLRYYW